MKLISLIKENKNTAAWMFLITSVAIHVFDETVNDFLPFYNQAVLTIRDRIGFFPAPTFSFGIWLGGLIGGITMGYALTYFIARGTKTIKVVTNFFGILMILNALGHILGSVVLRKVVPGTYSSPLLLLAAIIVVFRGFKT